MTQESRVMEPAMESQYNSLPLLYDQSWRLLICTVCQFAINHETTKEHLRNYHRTSLDRTRRAELETWAKQLNVCKKFDELDAFLPRWPNIATRIPNVKVKENGYRCDVCHKVTGQLDSMTKHLRDHNVKSTEVETKMTSNIPVQTAFASPVNYFEVQPVERATVSETMSASTRFLKKALMDYDKEMIEEVDRRCYIPTNTHYTSMTPWLQRTGWLTHLAGLQSRRMVTATRLPDETEPFYLKACELLKALLDDYHNDAKGTPEPIRCILYSRKTQEMETTPAEFKIQDKSFSGYVNPFLRFLCYLLREHKECNYRLSLTREQVRLLEAISERLREADDWNEDGGYETTKEMLFQLLMNFLEQKLTGRKPGDKFKSPLLHFLAIMGISETTFAWKTAYHYTSTLSGFAYIMRILYLAKAYSAIGEGSPDFAQQFREYHSDYIQDAALTPMYEVMGLRAIGMRMAEDHKPKPTVTLSHDGKTLFYKEHKIVLTELGGMVRATIKEAQQLLCDLVARPISYLLTRDPSLLHDDISYATNGTSFLEFNPQLEGGHERVLSWMDGAGRLSEFYMSSNMSEAEPIWSEKKILDYQGKVDRLLKLQMGIAHLTAGMPGRGLEFTSFKVRSDWNTARSGYIFDNALMMVSEYHKSQMRTKAPRVIARFLPAELGQIMVAIVADLEPFLSFLQRQVGLKRYNSSPYLWETEGDPASTKTLSTAIAEITQKHLGIELTVQPWRHIIIAIDRDVLQCRHPEGIDFDFNPETESPHDAQAGHSTGIANAWYGLRADLRSGLTTANLHQFRGVTNELHKFYGIPSFATLTAESPTKTMSPPKVPIPRSMPQQKRQSTLMSGPATPGSPISYQDNEGRTTPWRNKRPRRDDEAFEDDATGATKQMLLKQLQKRPFGFPNFKSPSQGLALCQIEEESSDLFVVLPTGGGKSVLYMLPCLLHPLRVIIVVCPFTALLNATLLECQQRGIHALQWEKGESRIVSLVIVSVELAVDALFLEYVQVLIERQVLSMVVFDEAHTIILDADYRKQMKGLSALAKIAPRKLALTATLPMYLETELRIELYMNTAAVIRASTSRPNLQYEVCTLPMLTQDESRDKAIEIMKQNVARLRPNEKAMIFPRTTGDCEHIATSLQAFCYYSNRENNSSSLQDWISTTTASVIVCTSALGTGMNIPSVRLIIFYDSAFKLSESVQQCGRAGRDGNPAKCLYIISEIEMDKAKRKATSNGPLNERQAMATFLTTKECRRKILATFEDLDDCGASCTRSKAHLCDNCAASISDLMPGTHAGMYLHSASLPATPSKVTGGSGGISPTKKIRNVSRFNTDLTDYSPTGAMDFSPTGPMDVSPAGSTTMRQAHATNDDDYEGTSLQIGQMAASGANASIRELPGGHASSQWGMSKSISLPTFGSSTATQSQLSHSRNVLSTQTSANTTIENTAPLQRDVRPNWSLETGGTQPLFNASVLSDRTTWRGGLMSTPSETPEALSRTDLTNYGPTPRASIESPFTADRDNRYATHHRHFLQWIFATLKPICAVCWLEKGQEAANHTYAATSCNSDIVPYGEYLDFRRGLNYEAGCNFKCGAPSFICMDKRDARCGYRDKVLPVCMAATKLADYQDIVEREIPAALRQGTAFRDWLADAFLTDQAKPRREWAPRKIGGDRVTNSIYLFEKVMRRKVELMGV